MVFIAARPETAIAGLSEWSEVVVSDGTRIGGVMPSEFYGQTLGGIPGPTFRSRAHFEAADLPDDVELWWVNHRGTALAYRRSQECDAIVSKNGVRGAPAASITPDHWGALADGANPDAAFVQSAINWAFYLRASTGKLQPVDFLAGTYLLDGDQEALSGQSVVFRGRGPTTTTIRRYDFTNRGSYAYGQRLDLGFFAEVGGTFEAHDMTFEGDFETPYHFVGNTYTVAYRYPSGNQYEGNCDDGGGATESRVDPATGDTISMQSVILGPDALAVDGAYNGHMMHIDGGPGVGQLVPIYDYEGSTRTAWVRPLRFGAATTSASYVHIGLSSPGMGLRLAQFDRVILRNVTVRGMRNQALQITNCTRVSLIGVHLEKCARGGASMRKCDQVEVIGCTGRYVADDVVFNSHEGEGTKKSIYTSVTGCNFVDCQGMRFLGARYLNVSGNILTRPITIGIMVGFNGRQTPVNQHSIKLSGNVITDILNRNSVAYEEDAGAFTAIRIASASALGASDYQTPGVSMDDGAVLSPGPGTFFTDADTPPAYFQPTTGVTVSGNQVQQIMDPGQSVEDINGFGVFYHRATLRTNGFVTGALTPGDLDVIPLEVLGPLHNAQIEGNTFNGKVWTEDGNAYGKPAIRFTNGQWAERGGNGPVDCRIDFDYALMGVRVTDNNLRNCTIGVQVNHQSNDTNYTYDMEIANNAIDCDPYHKSPLRTQPLDGTWTAANEYGIDAHRCDGVTIAQNDIENVPVPLRTTNRNTVIANRVFCRAVAVGDDATNAGVRAVPASDGRFIVIDRDSNPQSANYRDPGGTVMAAASMPATGRYVAGHFVRCSDPGTGYLGWLRLTTGNSHVDGTDWRTVYADPARSIEDGSVGEPSLAFAFDYNTGIYRPGLHELAIVTAGQEILRATMASVVMPKGLMTLSSHSVAAMSATIADDSVATFAIPTGRNSGFAVVAGPGALGRQALIAFNASGSLIIEKSTGFSSVGAAINVVTSDVSGTTGSDGKMTVAVQTGVIKIENRLGSSGTFSVFFL